MSAITRRDLEGFGGRPALHLDSFDSLSCLADCPDLEVLSLQHFPKVTSLEPLRSLSRLRYLSLTTAAGWDGSNRHLTVDTFAPLASLQRLEMLQILGVVPERERLEPLGRIGSLRKVSIGHTSFYQLEDFAALSVALPGARQSLSPVYQANFVSMCRRCARHPLLFLAGAKPRAPRYACPACGKAKIVSHLERWRRAGGMPAFAEASDMMPIELIARFGNPEAR